MLVTLCLAVGLAILIASLCSLFEAVLYSVPLSHVEVMAKSGSRSGKLLKQLKGQISKPIVAILTLNTIAETMGASVAGAAAAQVLGDENVVIFSIVFTLAILFLAEILPKTAGVAYCKTLAPLVARPLTLIVSLLTPVIWLSHQVTRLIQANSDEALVSSQEIMAITALSLKSGEIDKQQEQAIINILDLNKKSVRRVMTPRTVTFTLSEHLTVREAVEFKNKLELHSRIPIYDTEPDDIVGIIMRNDILLSAAEGNLGVKLAELMQPVNFVPESAPLPRVLLDFLEYRRHLFVVVDEYGGFTGVISLEDILEEIMGQEIMDESDETKDMRELARLKRRKLAPGLKSEAEAS